VKYNPQAYRDLAQRYRTDEAAATAAIVISTVAFAITAPLWLAALAHF